jgi:hypothetical protein
MEVNVVGDTFTSRGMRIVRSLVTAGPPVKFIYLIRR